LRAHTNFEAALGSGYTVFSIYSADSALVGVLAVVLTFLVASRRAKPSPGLASKTTVEAHS
jgi:hypothetical protein